MQWKVKASHPKLPGNLGTGTGTGTGVGTGTLVFETRCLGTSNTVSISIYISNCNKQKIKHFTCIKHVTMFTFNTNDILKMKSFEPRFIYTL